MRDAGNNLKRTKVMDGRRLFEFIFVAARMWNTCSCMWTFARNVGDDQRIAYVIRRVHRTQSKNRKQYRSNIAISDWMQATEDRHKCKGIMNINNNHIHLPLNWVVRDCSVLTDNDHFNWQRSFTLATTTNEFASKIEFPLQSDAFNYSCELRTHYIRKPN